jgi:predicted outer membrane protein
MLLTIEAVERCGAKNVKTFTTNISNDTNKNQSQGASPGFRENIESPQENTISQRKWDRLPAFQNTKKK